MVFIVFIVFIIFYFFSVYIWTNKKRCMKIFYNVFFLTTQQDKKTIKNTNCYNLIRNNPLFQDQTKYRLKDTYFIIIANLNDVFKIVKLPSSTIYTNQLFQKYFSTTYLTCQINNMEMMVYNVPINNLQIFFSTTHLISNTKHIFKT